MTVRRGDNRLISLWINEDDLERAKKAAEKDDVSLSELIRTLLKRDVRRKRITLEDDNRDRREFQWEWPE